MFYMIVLPPAKTRFRSSLVHKMRSSPATSTELGPSSTKHDPHSTKSGLESARFGPKSAQFDKSGRTCGRRVDRTVGRPVGWSARRSGRRLVRNRAKLARLRHPRSPKFHQSSPGLGHVRPGSDQNRADVDQICAIPVKSDQNRLGQTWTEIDKIGPTAFESAPTWLGSSQIWLEFDQMTCSCPPAENTYFILLCFSPPKRRFHSICLQKQNSVLS